MIYLLYPPTTAEWKYILFVKTFATPRIGNCDLYHNTASIYICSSFHRSIIDGRLEANTRYIGIEKGEIQGQGTHPQPIINR